MHNFETDSITLNSSSDTDLEDHRIMSTYLPLLREFIPSAAAEIESDIHDYMSQRGLAPYYASSFLVFYFSNFCFWVEVFSFIMLVYCSMRFLSSCQL